MKLILVTFCITQYIQNIIILTCNQYKKSLSFEESKWEEGNLRERGGKGGLSLTSVSLPFFYTLGEEFRRMKEKTLPIFSLALILACEWEG